MRDSSRTAARLDSLASSWVALALFFCASSALLAATFFPAYATNTSLLGTIILLEIILAAVWDYRQRFFPFLMLVFLFAGTGVPPFGFWHMVRWFALAAGAVVGVVTYLRGGQHYFSKFHLMAFFCVVAAIVSASASSYPQDSLSKVLSLFLLFLYASSGMRIAVLGREKKFFSALLIFGEVITLLAAFSYFVVRYDIFGNPNSLGAVMGVFVVPLMLWGVLVEDDSAQRRRRFVLALALLLLATSYARAGILAATVACGILCISLRRHQALLLLTGTSLLIALMALFIAPPASEHPDSLTSAFIYKGHRAEGVLGSRKSPWQQTLASVREHPWFGTGFGTSATGADVSEAFSAFRSSARDTREHGNSYLALLEWVGILGAWPFAGILLLAIVNVMKALARIRRSGNAASVLAPMAAVIIAGLVHAAFEDWLFAIGYYLCVFFWGFAFVLVDFVSVPEVSCAAKLQLQPAVRAGLNLPMPEIGHV